MGCEHWENLLSPYLEGDLNEEPKHLIGEHLSSCPSCTSLLSSLKELADAMTSFPELEVHPELITRLLSIPSKKSGRSWSFNLDFLLRPSLQPALAAVTIFLTMLSFYYFHPDKDQINKTVDRQIHLGYSKIGQLYSKAESFTSSLGGYKDNILVSLKNLNPFGQNED